MSSRSVDLVAASLLQMSQYADDLCAMNQYESLTATFKLQILTRICQRWHALGRFEMVLLFACLISPPAVLCTTSAGAGSRHPDKSIIPGKALFWPRRVRPAAAVPTAFGQQAVVFCNTFCSVQAVAGHTSFDSSLHELPSQQPAQAAGLTSGCQ